MHIQNIKAFGILFQSILSLKMHFWEIYQVYKYILKTKAHSLVCQRIVTLESPVDTLVLGISLTYMRINYKNVILKYMDKTS